MQLNDLQTMIFRNQLEFICFLSILQFDIRNDYKNVKKSYLFLVGTNFIYNIV